MNTSYLKTLDYDKTSHLLGGNYFLPNTLFTPEEIVEAGFVFVPCLTFIHQFNDPFNPILQSYIGYGNDLNPIDLNLIPMVMKTYRYCGVGYNKTYDVDSPRWRSIESLNDYFNKKDIFKPMIVEWMKEQKFHYVYMVMLEDSRAVYEEKELSQKWSTPAYFCRHAVNVRGCRLPIKL